MNGKSEEFFKRMIDFLPSTDAAYRASVATYGEVLQTVIIESIFMPEIIKLLKEESNIILLEQIFDYFEEVSTCGDAHLINIFSITALEILGNDRSILATAQKYMGPATTQLQIEADRDIGRSV
ncbi:hypothetical protein J2W91_004813 [Paenibacillus amylolyticus]|uniref:DUF7674 domain-containing protein n=1 Tax=Paenibacillus amylolyticus TaxID=1451 RepID=A0AAP5H5Q1_PAEAM|nr:resolvase [Paenibacillus amylolyticus]MDR6726302.1 hypothetical protein [Paenibacillus amylolyticus]